MTLNTQDFEKLKSQLQAKKKASSSGFLNGVKNAFNQRVDSAAQSQTDSTSGKQSIGSGVLQTIGQGAGFVGDVAFEGVKAVTPDVIERGVGGAVSKIAQTKPVQSAIGGITEWAKAHPEAAKNLQAVVDIASLVPIGKGVQVAEKGVVKGTQKAIGLTGDVAKGSLKKASEVKKKLIQFASPDADDMTKTILRESKTSDIDNFVKIQEKASIDPRAITPYEVLGDRMSEATKKLQKQLSEVGAKKSKIVEPLNEGLNPFDSKNLVNNLTSLKNSKSLLDTKSKSTIDNVIARAKDIKTKGNADKFIDEIQDMVYKGNKDLTIPVGSTLDKQLRGILGKFNTELKAVLPKEYGNLNARYSNLLKVTNVLNKALGEVVEGVSTRGGSLVKQFFSPSGRKAKELFAYIKKNTGIDLAKDATLARYVMELFNDPRAKTLLGGNIPTSVSGVLNKVVDFAVEKTGLGKGLQNAARKGSIEKAKQLTKPK